MAATIIDKQFGILHYVEDFEGNAFWSGKSVFKNYNIDIHFEALEENPSARQRDFLKSIDDLYDDIVPGIYSVLPKMLKEDKLLIDEEHFSGMFKPKAIMILKVKNNVFEWSMTWQSLINPKHFLSVDFKEFKPIKSLLEK